MKLLIMQVSPASHYFSPLRSKSFPQHPILKFPQFMFFPTIINHVSHPYRTHWQNCFVRISRSSKLWKADEIITVL